MVINKGGMVVEKGLYWSPVDGQRVNVGEEGMLPGDGSKSYLRISPFALLVIAPFFGMMYVIFLPLFGIGVFLVSWLVPLIGTLATVAITGVKVCSRSAGRGAFFGWNPTRAYFTASGKKRRRPAETGPTSPTGAKGGR